MQPLFRSEVIAHATGRLDGTVLLAAPLAAWAAVVFAASTLLLGAWFVATTTYTSKESVLGRLSPRGGVARAVAATNGTVTEFLVSEGDLVEPGMPLARIGTPPHSVPTDDGALNAALGRADAILDPSVATGGVQVVPAPIKGRVDALAAPVGHYVRRGDTVAVLSADDELEAELLVPAHVAGFVAVGQKLHLRFDALPFGRRAVQDGVVTHVSGTALGPVETDATGISVTTPVFPVRVRLAGQQIAVDGANVPLRAGMLLTADIVGHRRTLLESLFGPEA